MSFKIKFNEASISGLEKNVKDAFKKVIASNAMLNEVGKLVTEDIVETTRGERSIPDGLNHLKLLKESWITRKKRLASTNTKDSAYEEGKSNLTFTGQLLNSLKWKILGPGKIQTFFKGNHAPYVSGTGAKSGKSIKNEDLAKYVAIAGRPFIGVRPAIRVRIQRLVKGYVKRALVVARLTKENS